MSSFHTTFFVGQMVCHSTRKNSRNEYVSGKIVEIKNRKYLVKFDDNDTVEQCSSDKLWINKALVQEQNVGDQSKIPIAISKDTATHRVQLKNKPITQSESLIDESIKHKEKEEPKTVNSVNESTEESAIKAQVVDEKEPTKLITESINQNKAEVTKTGAENEEILILDDQEPINKEVRTVYFLLYQMKPHVAVCMLGYTNAFRCTRGEGSRKNRN